MIYIGIDTGNHTGVAVWNTATQRFEEVVTLPLWRALEVVRQWRDDMREQGVALHVIFEDARQRQWFPKERSASEYRGKLMGAGAVKRDAAIWEEFLADHDIPYTAQPPRPHLTKWNVDYWQHITGWTGRTSEHARDAALLVFGKR